MKRLFKPMILFTSLFILASVGFAYSAGNSVSVSSLFLGQVNMTPDHFKPSICPGSYQNLITGSGLIFGTNNRDLIYGSASGDLILGLGRNDCIIAGGSAAIGQR